MRLILLVTRREVVIWKRRMWRQGDTTQKERLPKSEDKSKCNKIPGELKKHL